MQTSDDVRSFTDELAHDPGSKVFVRLAEAMRHQGQLDVALKIALKGLERHPHLVDAHDVLARISADRGELQRAFDEWDMVLRLSPNHAGALKGMGFICFHRERFTDAERYLSAASRANPADDELPSALAHVRAAHADLESADPSNGLGMTSVVPEEWRHDIRYLFSDILVEDGQTALLLDNQGLVLAGSYPDENGIDVAQEVGAELSGVTDAARRATWHLELGDRSALLFETDSAVVAMTPTAQDGLLLVAASHATPLGLARRLLGQCAARATRWLAGAS